MRIVERWAIWVARDHRLRLSYTIVVQRFVVSLLIHIILHDIVNFLDCGTCSGNSSIPMRAAEDKPEERRIGSVYGSRCSRRLGTVNPLYFLYRYFVVNPLRVQ